jgi:hypothetical protein
VISDTALSCGVTPPEVVTQITNFRSEVTQLRALRLYANGQPSQSLRHFGYKMGMSILFKRGRVSLDSGLGRSSHSHSSQVLVIKIGQAKSSTETATMRMLFASLLKRLALVALGCQLGGLAHV